MKSKFLVLYNSPIPASQQMANASPEAAKAGVDAWMTWAQDAGDAVVDPGLPVVAVAEVTAHGSAASSSKAAGYSIMQAGSADAVSAILAKHPHLQMPGSSIEIL